MKPVTISILVLLLVTGCSVLSPENQPTAELKDLLRPEKLNLEMGMELTKLRIDIYRNTTTEETTDALGNKTTREVERNYHPLGFYINENIFFDLNGNLTFVIPRIFHTDTLKNFEITSTREGAFGDDFLKVALKNDTITFLKKGWFKDYDYAYLSNDTICLDEGQILSKKRIIIKPDELIYDPITIFQKMAVDHIVKNEQGYIVPKLFGTEKYEQSNRKTIKLDKAFDVFWYINGIEFKYSPYMSYFLYKTNNGYEIYRNSHLEKKLIISEDEVELVKLGKTIQIFKKEPQ